MVSNGQSWIIYFSSHQGIGSKRAGEQCVDLELISASQAENASSILVARSMYRSCNMGIYCPMRRMRVPEVPKQPRFDRHAHVPIRQYLVLKGNLQKNWSAALYCWSMQQHGMRIRAPSQLYAT